MPLEIEVIVGIKNRKDRVAAYVERKENGLPLFFEPENEPEAVIRQVLMNSNKKRKTVSKMMVGLSVSAMQKDERTNIIDSIIN